MDIIITRAQKKIFIYATAGIFAILLFWGFIYIPSEKQMQRYKHQLDAVNKQLEQVKMIDEIKEAISKGYTYTQSIESLKNKLEILNRSIAVDEETPLEYISSCARRFNLELLLIKPSEKKPLLDKTKNPIKIAGVDCYQLSVHLNLKGNYKSLGNYIETFSKEAPSLITIDNLRLSKLPREDILAADIFLTIYLKAQK